MRNRIQHILRKRITGTQKLKLIEEIVNEDNSSNLGINKLVKLDSDELQKLNTAYGKEFIELRIDSLDSYLYKTGKYYPSHYLTILNWIRRDGFKPITKIPETWECSFGIKHKKGELCDCIG